MCTYNFYQYYKKVPIIVLGKSFLSSDSIDLGSDEYDYPYSRKQFHIYYRRRRFKDFDGLQNSASVVRRRLKSV